MQYPKFNSKITTILLLRFGLLCLSFCTVSYASQPSEPTQHRVNNALCPTLIDGPAPLFGWQVNDLDRGEKQTAYQILVASSGEKCGASVGDLWDSGKVNSSKQNEIVYGGQSLVSNRCYWWKVRTWDKDDQVSVWSSPAVFETAFLDPSMWKAFWIGGDYERYRTEFSIPVGKPIAFARAYVSAKEFFDLKINGSRIGGNRVLEPGFSRFDVRRRYCVYDIAENLRPGANAIGVSIGRGHLSHFYIKSQEREFILQIEIRYQDGTTAQIISDKSAWKATKSGPIIPLPSNKSELYQGVNYDARNEDEWTQPAYNDSSWVAISTAKPAISNFRLSVQSAPPMKATTLLTPISRTEPLPGVYVFDMGQKITGWTQLTIEGQRGAIVTLKHAEKLYTSDTWANYTVSTNVTIHHEAAGVRFRIADNENFYLCQLRADGHLVISKKVKGLWTELKKVPFSFQVSKNYFLKIVLKDSVIKTSLDDMLVDTSEDKTFASGKIGFWQKGEQTASFDSIQVSPEGGWDASRNSLFSMNNGCSDEGLWVNRDNLVIIKSDDGKKGDNRRFTLKNNELMYSYDGGVTGQVDQSNLHVFSSSTHFADATDKYTLKGGALEIWEPTFTLHGFRWVEVHGFSSAPEFKNIKARVVHQSVDENPGSFSCSNELLNQIHKAFCWTYLNTAQHGMPVDCDQRDERMGWTGDAHCTAQAGNYNFDVHNFYDSWLDDLLDTQSSTGAVSRIAPTLSLKNMNDCKSTTWLSAYLSIPWETYMHTGSKEMLRKRYSSMKSFANWLATENVVDFIDRKDQYGDWGAPKIGAPNEHSAGSTGSELLATPFLYKCMMIQSRIASELELFDDAQHYSDLASKIKLAFNQKYLVNKEAYLDAEFKKSTTQTGNALALGSEICPQEVRLKVTKTLSDLIAENAGHLSTGVLGTKFLLSALCENGREDVAYQLATKTTFPSWGKWIKEGLTSTCEFWNMSKSHGHAYLGGPIDAYFYKYLAGISPIKAGYTEFSIKPYIKNDLKYVHAIVKTAKGDVVSRWKRDGSSLFELEVNVPVNTEATVHLPNIGFEFKNALITESDHVVFNKGVPVIPNSQEINIIGEQGDYWICRLKSGAYHFKMTSSHPKADTQP